MKIEVTRDDIDNAVLIYREAGTVLPITACCPIAQAFKRTFPNANEVHVFNIDATVTIDNCTLWFRVHEKDFQAMAAITRARRENWLTDCKPRVLEFDEDRP